MAKIFLVESVECNATALNYLKEILMRNNPGKYEFYRAYTVCGFSVAVTELGDKTRGMIFVVGLYLKISPDDGIRAVKFLRKYGYENPIFVWSKNAFVSKYRQKALAAGADNVFERYVEDQKLVAAIEEASKSTPKEES